MSPCMLVLVAALWARGAHGQRARTLAHAGRPLPAWRTAAFTAGIVVMVAGADPWEWLREDRSLTGHMAQHLLLGDIGPLLLLLGLTGPMLRPVLAAPGLRHGRRLASPAVAGPVAVALLTVWHMPALFDAAVRNEGLHAVEHLAFAAAGVCLWLPVLGILPAPGFGHGHRVAFHLVVRLPHMVLGNALLFAPGVLYGVYADRAEDALADQRAAGALLLGEGTVTTVAVVAVLGLHALRQSGRRQRLLDAGVPAARARLLARRDGAGG